MSDRLPAHIEVGALIRRIEALGGNAAVVARGDRDAGAILFAVGERGVPLGLLERTLSSSAGYAWGFREASEFESAGGLDATLTRRRSVDPDLWIVDLDIPGAQRFVAEMVAAG